MVRITRLLCPGLLLLAACGAPVPVASTVYACEGGLVLQVAFFRDVAAVTVPGGEVLRLAQQPSGSGFRYGGSGYGLQGKGRSAQWTVGGANPLSCLAMGG